MDTAFRSTVKFALKGIGMDEWETYVPPGLLSREVLEAAYDAYQQTLHQARVFIDREFEEICEESNIADKLTTIDVMCAEQGYTVDGAERGERAEGAEGTGRGPRQSTSHPRLARAATLKAKKEALEHLRKIYEDVGRRNEALEEALEKRKGEARALTRREGGVGEMVGARLEGVARLVMAWEKTGDSGRG